MTMNLKTLNLNVLDNEESNTSGNQQWLEIDQEELDQVSITKDISQTSKRRYDGIVRFLNIFFDSNLELRHFIGIGVMIVIGIMCTTAIVLAIPKGSRKKNYVPQVISSCDSMTCQEKCELEGPNRLWARLDENSDESSNVGRCLGRCGYGIEEASENLERGNAASGRGPCGNRSQHCCHTQPVQTLDGIDSCLCWSFTKTTVTDGSDQDGEGSEIDGGDSKTISGGPSGGFSSFTFSEGKNSGDGDENSRDKSGGG
uniref:Uncharacterized protein n=1 Tax=Proboscia inermis TaxID=420281 RepID=A0A7S0GK56_9STRA|mmetsp:Transcript_50578/g.50944  ORF Transcript_50578/g.50944 Transcript_50578/m.50944 type:complete len:257 (+) Transcript_50578:31-801(+)